MDLENFYQNLKIKKYYLTKMTEKILNKESPREIAEETENLDNETIVNLESIAKDLKDLLKLHDSEGHIVSSGEMAREITNKLIQKYPKYGEFITAIVDGLNGSTREWIQLSSHLVLANKDLPQVMEKFWEIYYQFRHPYLGGESDKQAVITEAAAIQIFEILGFSTRQSTPAEDESNELRRGADFFANNIPIQVKSKRGKQTVSVSKNFNQDGSWYLQINVHRKYGVDLNTGMPSPEIIQKVKEELIRLGIL